MTEPKPIIKWVGGKTQILNQIFDKFPKEINDYYEPFLGGGSVLFALLSKIKQGQIRLTGKIYASDLNDALIYMYKNIQTRPQELYEQVQKYCDDYQRCAGVDIDRSPKLMNMVLIDNTLRVSTMVSKETYYYWIRQKYNNLKPADKKSIAGSALLIFLNKTCFRGIYRVGPNGFNVPYGNYKNPEVINREHLMEVSKLIRPVVFECLDFENSVPRALSSSHPNTFIYMDPPYAPESTTSFVGYTGEGFPLEKHNKLFELCKRLNEKKIRFILSNADVTLVTQAFDRHIYSIERILCRRTINSKNPEARTNEVLIWNLH